MLLLSLVALCLIKGSIGQLLCDLDQIQVTQTLVVNTSSMPSSYRYPQNQKDVKVNDDDEDMGSLSKSNILGGEAIFHVKIANNCPCSAAAAVTFFCDGFMPGLVKMEILRVEGPRCLLIEGEALLQLEPVRFDYSSAHQLPLFLESADFTC